MFFLLFLWSGWILTNVWFAPNSMVKIGSNFLHFEKSGQRLWTGGCDVNIEFELENPELELNDVTISIPLPHGCGTPNISECDGDYTHDTRRQQLLWQHTIIDQNNKSGSMEFSCGGNPDDFFPVTVEWNSSKSYSGVQVKMSKNIFP